MLIIVIVIIIGVYFYSQRKKAESFDTHPYDEEYDESENETYYDENLEDELTKINEEIEQIKYIKNAYTSKWMFTYNEKGAFYKLNEIARKNDMILFAKVRLLDLVTPARYHPKYKTNLYRIQAKHVDFVLTAKNLVAKYVIELDDSSHDTEERKARDQFVDNVLTACGYKILHTREIDPAEIQSFIDKHK